MLLASPGLADTAATPCAVNAIACACYVCLVLILACIDGPMTVRDRINVDPSPFVKGRPTHQLQEINHEQSEARSPNTAELADHLYRSSAADGVRRAVHRPPDIEEQRRGPRQSGEGVQGPDHHHDGRDAGVLRLHLPRAARRVPRQAGARAHFDELVGRQEGARCAQGQRTQQGGSFGPVDRGVQQHLCAVGDAGGRLRRRRRRSRCSG